MVMMMVMLMVLGCSIFSCSAWHDEASVFLFVCIVERERI